jgi:nicotinamide-nucleotide amidase
MTAPETNRHLTAEIISIGDEITSGARLDTNSQWLSRRLGELGVTVRYHSTVGDTLSDNVDVFRIAAERVDVVVASGGLGPTQDDLTREALALVVDRKLEFRESAMQHIQAMFARRNREMPERNRVQAMFPEGSDEIFNPQGTAPGIDLVVPRLADSSTASRVYALPGVPAEMKRMFDDTVAERILQQSGGATKIRQCVMKFFGTGESDMERRLGDMISRSRQPRVGITVSEATISLRITATSESEQQCDQLIQQTRSEILRLVPEFYFGDGDGVEQYHTIGDQLRERAESLVVVEFGRAAPLAGWFASLGETSAYRGGLSLAKLDDLVQLFDAPNEAAAIAIVTKRFQADWLLMVDGYPPVNPDSDAPMPESSIRLLVISPQGKQYVTSVSMGGHPEVLHPRIAKSAMAWMRKIMNTSPS